MSDLFTLDPSVNITVKKPYEIKVQLTNKDCMPNYSSEEAAGLDMRANIIDRVPGIILVQQQKIVGLREHMP